MTGCESRSGRERAAVGALLAEIFGSEVVYAHEPTGAPLITVAGQRKRVSISHSVTTVAVVVADDDELSIGVDVETYRAQLERVSSRFLSPVEAAVFTSSLDLLKVWTAKEAVYKAAMTPGLALAEIDCTALDDGVVTARGIIYRVTFPVVGIDETVAVAVSY